ncbi:MAG: sigma-70 family RNA polymerase sigma factor [Bacteroidetes bacterium]|nr:sigma-70 family RNA polymerase sigma factor [Bacteroidota bacterium]
MVLKVSHISPLPFEPGQESMLMSAFRNGKQGAFKTVYEIFFRSQCFFANNLIHDKEQVEDIVSESFVKLWDRRGEFIALENVKAFLFTVTKNACLNHLKHINRRNSSQRELRYLYAENFYDMELQIIHADLLVLVYYEIEKLPPLAKKILKLTFNEGLTIEEIAKKLNMPMQNVRNNKSRAIELLKLKLGKKSVLPIIVFLLQQLYTH